MPDVFSKEKRSAVMAKIRGHGNRDTEVAMIKLFRQEQITGWRRHQPLFGKPDFVFRKARLALFVDGCFWHSCPKHSTRPVNNSAFWQKKFATNIARDRIVTRTLRKQGWRVVRVWEHELSKRVQARLVRKISKALVLKV